MPRRSPRAARLLIVTLAMATIAVFAPTNNAFAVDLFTDDFESGNLNAWTATNAFTNQQAITHAGVRAGRATASGGGAYAERTIAGQSDVYLRAFVNVVSHGGTNQLLRMKSSTGSDSTISLMLLQSNQLQVKNHVLGGENRNTGVTLTPGTWVDLQLHLHIGGANGAAELWVNGVPAGGLAGAWNFGTTLIDSVVLGAQATNSPAVDIAFDDVKAATTFIGSGGGPEIPATPTGLTPTSVAHNRVDLTWNASTGATGYTVYRNGTPVGTVGTTTLSDTTVAAETTYQYTVDASNTAGKSPPSAAIPVTTPAAPTGGGGVVMAAGDIACDPASGSFRNGDGTSSQCRAKYTAPLLNAADRILALGDTQYECGGASAYAASYAKSWGIPSLKSKTYPAIGDEEYATGGTGCGAAGADGYFGYFGSVAMGPGGYYSYDFAGWHFVVLNSECNSPGVGGCAEGSPQNNWLEADLASNTEACTLAYWHRPAFFSKVNGNRTAGAASAVKPFWDDLQLAGVEIVLTGHSHWYERFKPQNSSGAFLSNGIVQWVVGTGGKSHNTNALAAPASRHVNSVTANASTFGVLELTLNAGSYNWRYLVEGSSSYSDVGTPTNCH